MPKYQAPLRDMKFLLYDVLEIGTYSNLPRFSEAPRDVVEAVLDGGAAFATEGMVARGDRVPAGDRFAAVMAGHHGRVHRRAQPPPRDGARREARVSFCRRPRIRQ